MVASGPSAQSTMTRSGRCGSLRAASPVSSPSARTTLAPAWIRRAAMAGASNGDLATMSTRAPASSIGFDSRGPARIGAFPQGNGEGEDRSAARVVAQRQRAAHQRDETAGNGEAEAGALEAAGVGAVALLEMLEDRRAPVGRHARPGVDHGEPQLMPFAPLDRDADSAGPGELHRVAGEVHQHLSEAHAVAPHETRRVRVDRSGDLEPLALGARREQLEHALNEPREVDCLDEEPDMAALDPGQVEDLVDERDQRRPRTANRLDV